MLCYDLWLLFLPLAVALFPSFSGWAHSWWSAALLPGQAKRNTIQDYFLLGISCVPKGCFQILWIGSQSTGCLAKVPVVVTAAVLLTTPCADNLQSLCSRAACLLCIQKCANNIWAPRMSLIKNVTKESSCWTARSACIVGFSANYTTG